MCHFNSSNELWLQTATKRSKVLIRHSYMWAADVFYDRSCYGRFVIFKEKYQKETVSLAGKYQVSLQKKNSWF